jgi:Cft2 family RNA processing exonuclease
MNDIKNPDVLQKQDSELSWIRGMIQSAQKRRWFGKIVIEFKKGMIDITRCEETFKPPKKEN